MTRLAGRHRDEDGAIAVLVALTSVVLFLICGLVVDLGLARVTKVRSQNAADAAALAAAGAVFPAAGSKCSDGTDGPCLSDAMHEAIDYAESNFDVTAAEWSSCPPPPDGFTAPDPSHRCISFDDLAHPDKVWVVIPTRDVDAGLGALAGIDQIPVQTRARAAIGGHAPFTCGMCFLGPIGGENADFTVLGGSILVNGDVSVGPNSYWSADGAIGIAGSADGGQFDPPWRSVEPFTDPWAAVADLPPSYSPTAPRPSKPACANNSADAGGPGVYGSFEIPNTGTCALQPGLYVITGAWTMKNNSVLAGDNVTLYFTCGSTTAPRVCAPGEAGGYLDAKNGSVDLSGAAAGVGRRLTIMYDRENTRNLGLQGNGFTSVAGAIYAPHSKLDFNGSSLFVVKYGPIISDGVLVANGNKSGLRVDDSIDAALPPTPRTVGLDR